MVAMMMLSLMLTLAATSPEAIAPQTGQSVDVFPETFHGEWAQYPIACGTGDNDDRLIITDRKARFYESEGQLISAVWLDDGQLKTVMTMDEQGDIWQDTSVWRLSPDGQTLTKVLDDGDGYERQRCPSPREAPPA